MQKRSVRFFPFFKSPFHIRIHCLSPPAPVRCASTGRGFLWHYSALPHIAIPLHFKDIQSSSEPLQVVAHHHPSQPLLVIAHRHFSMPLLVFAVLCVACHRCSMPLLVLAVLCCAKPSRVVARPCGTFATPFDAEHYPCIALPRFASLGLALPLQCEASPRFSVAYSISSQRNRPLPLLRHWPIPEYLP